MRAHPAGKLGEGATAVSGAELCERQFQSTPPARGRLEKILLRLKKTAISIHAPREGGRLPSEYPGSGANDISIHAPARGGDHHGVHLVHRGRIISIHAPARGATNPGPGVIGGIPISIHAPARGGDGRIAHQHSAKHISIHAPRGGRPSQWRSAGVRSNFNPRPREGGDRMTGQPR